VPVSVTLSAADTVTLPDPLMSPALATTLAPVPFAATRMLPPLPALIA